MSRREELLSVKRREWDNVLHGVKGVFVISSGRKHDSGYACMDFVAETEDGLVRFGGGCDDIRLAGTGFRMDCEYPSRIIHIWNSRNTFSISHDLSSMILFMIRI